MMKMKDKIFKWYDWIVIIISLSLIICSPILLSQKWGLGNFGEPSQIGDTIGGITSPFVGLLGAYFVFIGFRAQLEANRLLKSQWREDKIRQEFDSMVARFEVILNNFQSGDKKGFVGLDYYTRSIADMIVAIQNKSASHQLFHQKLKEQVNSLEMRNLHHLLINFQYLVQFIDREKNNAQFPTFWLFQIFKILLLRTVVEYLKSILLVFSMFE